MPRRMTEEQHLHSKERQASWYQKNKERILAERKEYRAQNLESIKAKKCVYHKEHSEVRKKYTEENKERVREHNRKWHKLARAGAKGPLWQMRISLWGVLKSAFRGRYKKTGRATELLGADWEIVVQHLGPKPGPDYDLDHICPCAQARNEAELIKLQHYTNLRWYPAAENDSKKAKWTPEGAAPCVRLLLRPWQKSSLIVASEASNSAVASSPNRSQQQEQETPDGT